MALAWCLSASISASAASAREQRQQFNKAWTLAKRGAEWQAQAQGLAGYPLLPYLEYAALEHRIDAASLAEVSTFIEAHSDSPLADKLRWRALRAWSKLQRHSEFLALLPAEALSDPALRCAAWTALHHAQPHALEALRAAAKLWRETPKAEPACSAAFAALEKAGQLPTEQRLARIDAAFAAGDLKLVGWLIGKLPAPDALAPARRLKLRQAGLPGFSDALKWKDQTANRAIVTEALVRGAARDPRAAEVWRIKLRTRFRFDAEQQRAIEEAIALAASIDNLDEASAWLQRLAAPPYRDPRLNEWASRYWLGRGKLETALPVLANMPAELRAQPRWRYAHARVLELTGGDPSVVRAEYAAIATDTGFFPFLAADRIGADYALCETPYLEDPERLQRLRSAGAWLRAMELRELGHRELAASEINHLLSSQDSEGRVQLAALLLQAKWYDMAITLLGTPQFQRYYSLRFPRPWGRNIDRNAKRQGLDPNWTSGLIRAESAFNRTARSVADARGLMQMLPATARQLVGARGAAPDLYSPLISLRLGTRYLRQQFERFDRDPLATTAAYNAGPGAVQRWLPKMSRQWPELWVETIPFHETRDYVARVMAFSVVYDWRSDGQLQRLGARIGLLEDAPVKAVCPKR
jgi:soluble lytic murein transglycosylase